MGEIVPLGNAQTEKKPARIICPYCKQEILIDIRSFNDNISDVIKDNCIKCGGAIHVGLLILAHPDLTGLYTCIQMCTEAMNKGNVLGG